MIHRIVLYAFECCEESCDGYEHARQTSSVAALEYLWLRRTTTMHNGIAPTNATQAKDRLYAQLANSLGRMSRAISQTADLCEQLQVDLHAMRTFAGLDAAK
jgi:hypothetical protein